MVSGNGVREDTSIIGFYSSRESGVHNRLSTERTRVIINWPGGRESYVHIRLSQGNID